MRKKKGLPVLAGILAAAVLITSCGSAGYSKNTAPEAIADLNNSAPPMAAAEAEESAWEDGAAEEEWTEDAMADTADWDDADAGGSEEAASDDDSSGEYKNLDKIVYTCSVDMQTLEYDKSVKDLKDAVKSTGGIIESETESDNNYSWYYDSSDSYGANNRNLYLTVRIPSDKYEAFVNSLSDYGKVMNKTQNADNISKTYNDKQTYIASLETEQKRLLEMMDKAETIEDMMAVEERLTEVQRQLNQYKTDLEAMDMDLAYSTVTLSLQEVQKITDQPTPRDSFGTRLKKAFISAWAGFAEFWQDFLFALIYLLPAILVIGVIVWIILFATRKKRKERKEKKRAEREMIEDLKRRARESGPDKSGEL